MPWDKIWSFLNTASPITSFLFTVIIIVWLCLRFWSQRGARSVSGCLSDLKAMLAAHIGTTDAIFQDFRGRSSSELSLLEKIAQELVRMNAKSGEHISPENAKRIITYQWNWCKDQTAQLMVNSIENNNFYGNEAVVVRKLRRAWKQVANDSQSSIKCMSGLTYPYEPLYTTHIPLIWERVFHWAIPLYHRQGMDKKSFKDRLSDLTARIQALFDHVLYTYFRMTEDVQSGALYDRDDPRRSSGIVPAGEDTAEDAMIASLRDYDSHHASSSSNFNIDDVTEEMKRRQEETGRIDNP